MSVRLPDSGGRVCTAAKSNAQINGFRVYKFFFSRQMFSLLFSLASPDRPAFRYNHLRFLANKVFFVGSDNLFTKRFVGAKCCADKTFTFFVLFQIFRQQHPGNRGGTDSPDKTFCKWFVLFAYFSLFVFVFP